MAALLPRAFAEFIGTLTLIAVGVGVIHAAAGDLLAIALAHGLAIAVMVTAVGHVSGAHFNPAVTFGLLVTRRIHVLDAVVYWVAQLAGAVAGAALLGFVYGDQSLVAATPVLGEGFTWTQGLLAEVLMTFLLMWVIFGVAVDPDGAFGKVAGLPIGLTITADILMMGAVTGAAMNPARWLGPAVLSGTYTDGWVYWVGALVGAALAAFAYVAVIRPRQVAA